MQQKRYPLYCSFDDICVTKFRPNVTKIRQNVTKNRLGSDVKENFLAVWRRCQNIFSQHSKNTKNRSLPHSNGIATILQ